MKGEGEYILRWEMLVAMPHLQSKAGLVRFYSHNNNLMKVGLKEYHRAKPAKVDLNLDLLGPIPYANVCCYTMPKSEFLRLIFPIWIVTTAPTI